MLLKDSNLSMKQFQAVDQPYNLPDDLNLFSWSFPFLSEKVTAMLNGILNNCTARELREKEDGLKVVVELLETAQKDEKEKLVRKIHLKNKIR